MGKHSEDKYSHNKKREKGHNEAGTISVLDLSIGDDQFQFDTNIYDAVTKTENELHSIEEKIHETEESIKKLTPACDKTDYILAATCGALCGVIDVFYVGKPGKSPLGDITDEWFKKCTRNFAKLNGWDGKKNPSTESAIRFLEKKFEVPYDQRGAGDAGSIIFDLNPGNHHFKSLAHNPTLLGLFFSILDQFNNTSHFVAGGELIELQKADDKLELKGKTIPGKLFCGFVNWFGHLISDMSGASGSSGRGMGIPSPFMSWVNDLIVIKRKLKIPTSEFDQYLNELAVQIYKEGYDIRFTATQIIPVFINELLVRTTYAVRRLIHYFAHVRQEDPSCSMLWKTCEPFSNATVKRMLTVAHGTFCLVDAGDAVAQGFVKGAGGFNVKECIMRINIVGVGRFTISLYGEVNRGVKRYSLQGEVHFLKRKKSVLEYYLDGLSVLAEIYDDQEIFIFIDDLKNSQLYQQAFDKSIILAEKRNVPKDKILRTKEDIDSYFRGGSQ